MRGAVGGGIGPWYNPGVDSVRAFAPATVSNVGPGFDIFGFALAAPGDEAVVSFHSSPGVVVAAIHGDGGRLPLDPRRNTAGVAVEALRRAVGEGRGLRIELFKNLPLGSGMGSSAASAAAAVFSANELLGRPLSPRELLPFCLEAERAACGSGHADNAAPSLLGGFVLVRGTLPLDVVELPVPAGLHCALVHPRLEIRTADARRVLPHMVPLADAVRQWGNVAGLTAGLLQGDMDLLRRSLRDVIVEPARAGLLPHYHPVRAAALDAGALGCGISGSGPAMFALADSLETAGRASAAMANACRETGLACEQHVSPLGQPGARRLE